LYLAYFFKTYFSFFKFFFDYALGTALLSEYMPNGNLRDKLADTSLPLSLPKRIKIALDIATGLKYLDGCHDYEKIRKHESLKSNNIMIGRDWEIKIADYGQGHIKDLARTMTAIGNIAWTGTSLFSIPFRLLSVLF
jgi:serine/threonine protein kinase